MNPLPTDLHTGSRRDSPLSSTVRQHKQVPLYPNPESPLFWRRQLTSPSHNLVISLPNVSTRQFRCKKTISLASPGIPTRASVVEVGCHNHHTIIYHRMANSRLALLVLALSRTKLGHIYFSSYCTKQFSLPHHPRTFSSIYPLGGLGRHSK